MNEGNKNARHYTEDYLYARISMNYQHYISHLETLTKEEIFDKAWEITTTKLMHDYVVEGNYQFTSDEINQLMESRAPLDMLCKSIKSSHGIILLELSLNVGTCNAENLEQFTDGYSLKMREAMISGNWDSARKAEELQKNMDQAYSDFKLQMLGKDKSELLSNVSRIACYTAIYKEFGYQNKDADELDALLSFNNPLEALAINYMQGQNNDFAYLPEWCDALEFEVDKACTPPKAQESIVLNRTTKSRSRER